MAPLKRHDTVVTPTGRHPAIDGRPKPCRTDTRKHLLFVDSAKAKQTSRQRGDDDLESDDSIEQVVLDAQTQLSRFR
jgi:hypothetical protein